jgi:SET domain-containing protein
MIHQSLYIELTEKKGKGVFTAENIPEGFVIELSPVIVMEKEDRIHLDKTLLHDYIFEWGANKDKCCMALGFIPIYNHSYKSNCEYFMDFDEETIFVKTVRDIEKGEELTINYNGDWDDETKVWFEVQSEN